MKKWLKITLIVLLAALLLGAVGFVVWAENPLPAEPVALEALQDDALVDVIQTDDAIVFRPKENTPQVGLIFYPGGRVDFRAYAPPLRQVAANGFLVVLPRMPLNLAFLDGERAAEIIPQYPQVQTWAVGGHSLGGAMAARFAWAHPDQVDGLVLWASWPADGNDLSGYDLPVLSIYGTRDMAGMDKFDHSRNLLPADTNWIVLEGGNHANFGAYGPQPGDNEATLDRSLQWEMTVQATSGFLARLGAGQ